ncbi:hypothetical protein KC361_g166 [Hortaea werneckii]|nr:hypothetical protein KC361_g166 [Hortaea werneckii]
MSIYGFRSRTCRRLRCIIWKEIHIGAEILVAIRIDQEIICKSICLATFKLTGEREVVGRTDILESMANPMHGLTYPSAKHSSAVFCATALAATSVKLAKRALIDSMVIERGLSPVGRIPGKGGQSRCGRTRECIDRVAKGVNKPPVVDFAIILAQIWYVLAEDMRGSHGRPRANTQPLPLTSDFPR